MKIDPSKFMDKQIMDLINNHPNRSNDAVEPQPSHYPTTNYSAYARDHDTNNNINKDGEDEVDGREEIVPSYDFHPIRPVSAGSSTVRNWASDPSSIAASFTLSAPSPLRQNYGAFESVEQGKAVAEKDRGAFDMTAIVSEVDYAVKKHADNLLVVLEGVSARLTQLETRTRSLESSVDELKVSVGNNHGSTEGGIGHLENILREVQMGVQVLKDKQEIVEAQLLLAKMQVSKADQLPESQNTMNMDASQQSAPTPLPSHHPVHPPVPFPQSMPPAPLPSAAVPSPATQQNLPHPAPLQSQFPQNQIPPVHPHDPYYPPPGQQYQSPSSQPPHIPPAAFTHPSPGAPPHPSPPALPHQPSLPPSQHPQQPPPQTQPSPVQHPEQGSYLPPNYPPNLRQPSSGVPPTQQHYGAPLHMYEPPTSRPSSTFSAGYGNSPSGPTEPLYGGLASQYGGSPAIKPPQLSSSAVTYGKVGGYPQLPTAQILPQALPTASSISGGSNPGAGNRVPIDDVVDRVTSMGFPREQVRATVRKLTENGQSVDLNMVLDKLMNDGESQPQRGWFGR